MSSYLVAPGAAVAIQDRSRWPKVSFCIPTKNREHTIAACLASIRAQDYPDIEVVVVDNGSADRTIEIARHYADVIAACGGALGAVRQHSIDRSTGEILALFDDDIIIPHPHWLARAVAALDTDDGASTLWPVLIPPPTAGWVTRCFFELNDAIFAERRQRATAVFGGGNSLFRRSAVSTIGGFNQQIGFGEDFDLATRLKNAGFRVILHEDPLIHDSMSSLREIYRKQIWGASAVEKHGTALLAQSFGEMFHEQVVVGLRTMVKGLLVERKPWWTTYPLILSAKALPYSRALIAHRSARQVKEE